MASELLSQEVKDAGNVKSILKKERRKVTRDNASRAAKNGTNFVKNRYKRQKVALDSLAWQSVSKFDGIDDFEGFYGLEEVDDVEVVKEDGLITFRAKEELPNHEALSDAAQEAEEEWQGFTDVEDAEQMSTSVRASSKDKSVKKAQRLQADDELGQLSFNVLNTEAEIETKDLKAWRPFHLSTEIIASLAKLAFIKPTAIQSATIPPITDGYDVIGKAQTGSGKTLAYGIPIVETYLERKEPESRAAHALILAPTRELAHQIAAHISALCSTFEGPRIMTLTGGLSSHKQQRQLQTADIIVATPGRLWEVMEGSKEILARLSDILYLVIDEADRLLSPGHFQEMSDILTALDRQDEFVEDQETKVKELKPRQTLVFSATLDKGLQAKLGNRKQLSSSGQQESMMYLLEKLNFRDEKPKFIDVDPATRVAHGIREGMVECAGLEKDLYLYAMLMLHPQTRALVFTNSISAVKRLTPLLQNLAIPVNALHSSMPQKARLRNIERFSSAKSSILVATDIAARGLDIPGVQLVLHYHLPRTADAYVHRSGRTARGEARGASILLCAPEEINGLRRLIAQVHASSDAKSKGIATISVDRRVISKLKPRVTLAKKLADVNVAKDKGRKEDAFLREAADELGVDYDSEELETGAGRRGRGNQRKHKERQNRQVGKDELASSRAELKMLLHQRINLGHSERYIAQGVIDIDNLLAGVAGDFLGTAPLLELDES